MTTFQNPSQDVIADYLKSAKNIAVVGLSSVKIVQLTVFLR